VGDAIRSNEVAAQPGRPVPVGRERRTCASASGLETDRSRVMMGKVLKEGTEASGRESVLRC